MNRNSGFKNIIIGLFSKIILIIIGIILPRLVLVNLGSEANGLLNSVTAALTYMSLLEAGVGTASLQALYKPCATNDKKSINSILSATNHFYVRTGIVYFVCVLLLSIIYPLVVTSTIPKWEIFCVVLLTGLSGVLSYLFQGKFKILLSAEGKNYITTIIVTCTNILINITKAVLLVTGFDVVAVQASYFIVNILQTIIFGVYIKYKYKWIDLSEKPNFKAISQKNAVLVHQISSLIFSNTDAIILSIFTSFKEVSVYSLYVLIFGLASSVGEMLYESYRYMLGQMYHIDRAHFMRLYNTYEVFIFILSFSLFTVTRALINPFLTLYTLGVNDISYADRILPWMFAVYYIMNNGRTSSNTVINIAERFEDTKWRSVLESVINITVSLIAVQRYGIYGVLIGTIAALLYRTNDMILYASNILKRSSLVTYKRWVANIIGFVIVSYLLTICSFDSRNYLQLGIYGIFTGVFVTVFYVAINYVIDRECVVRGFRIIINILKKVMVSS